MLCPECNTENSDNTKFCKNCGASLSGKGFSQGPMVSQGRASSNQSVVSDNRNMMIIVLAVVLCAVIIVGALVLMNNNNSSDVETEENQIKKHKKIIQKNDISSELELDTITQKDLFQNYPLFNKFPMDLKKMASYFTEITINLLYKLFNVNIEELNKKYDDLNQTVNGRIINKKINIENFNQTDINNLIANIHKSYNNKIIDKNVYEDKIKEWFEFSKEFHSFIPNNSMENIISNTSQIIHRKFFEILIKTFFPDIISVILLKILRRLKSILFTNKNRKYYLDFEFLNEEQNSYMLFNSSIY